MRSSAFLTGSGCTDQPAGFSSDALEDNKRVNLLHVSSKNSCLLDGKSHVSCRRCKTGRVIGSEQVVVDGFRDTDTDHVIAVFFGIGLNAVDGVHRVVSADQEEIADVVLFEQFENDRQILLLQFMSA